MEICSRCNEPVDSNAVLLKSGTYMCPACFQKKYLPNAPVAAGPAGNSFTIEALCLVALALGISFGVYLWYANERESRKAAELALVADEKRRKEEREINDANLQRYREAQKLAEAARRAEDVQRETERLKRMEAAMAASKAESKARLERLDALRKEELLRQQEEEQKRDTARQSEGDPTKRAEEARFEKEITETMKKRNAEIEGYRKTIREGVDAVKKWESERATKERTYQAHKVIYEMQVKQCTTMEGNLYLKGNNLAVAQARYDAACREVKSSFEIANKMADEIKTMDNKIKETIESVKLAEKSLAELNASIAAEPKTYWNSPTRLDTTVEAGIHKRNPKFKTLYRKDGTSIQIQSMIASEKEINYKDESGKWQVIAKTEVDKIENNDAVSEKDLDPNAKKNGSERVIGF